MTPPRLHVVPAIASNTALVLRRGPSGQVASLIWNRDSGELFLGQWLKGRIYEYRTDLSPDGRHIVYFAGTGRKWWTAISRAPWLRAIWLAPRVGTWHGGGAFTPEGRVFLNGDHPASDLPDGLLPASPRAYPHGTDGFHMGGLYPAMQQARGWRIVTGTRYDTRLEKQVAPGCILKLSFGLHRSNRGIISNQYALEFQGQITPQPDWEWAEPWRGGLQVARRGALWAVPIGTKKTGKPELICDLNDLRFQSREAPYAGIRREW